MPVRNISMLLKTTDCSVAALVCSDGGLLRCIVVCCTGLPYLNLRAVLLAVRLAQTQLSKNLMVLLRIASNPTSAVLRRPRRGFELKVASQFARPISRRSVRPFVRLRGDLGSCQKPLGPSPFGPFDRLRAQEVQEPRREDFGGLSISYHTRLWLGHPAAAGRGRHGGQWRTGRATGTSQRVSP